MALAGTGVPASVTISDMPDVMKDDVLPNLKRNEAILSLSRGSCPIHAMPLVWGQTEIDHKTFGGKEQQPQIIIGADLVRNLEVGKLLLKAVKAIQALYLNSEPSRVVPFFYCYGLNRHGLKWFLDEMRQSCDSTMLNIPETGFKIPNCRIEVFTPRSSAA